MPWMIKYGLHLQEPTTLPWGYWWSPRILVAPGLKSLLIALASSGSPLTLEEISALLGYTEGTNFRRAFKLWTGHPPSYFRPA
jgi:AraC-like DNA-binding protein